MGFLNSLLARVSALEKGMLAGIVVVAVLVDLRLQPHWWPALPIRSQHSELALVGECAVSNANGKARLADWCRAGGALSE